MATINDRDVAYAVKIRKWANLKGQAGITGKLV